MAQAVLTEERNPHQGDRAEYRLYVFAFYPLCFAAALIGRLVRKRVSHARRGSVFHEAADMAQSVIPWVFSGR